MKKTFNYISYCIYSFIPLYFALLGYTLVRQDNEDVILVLILILSSIFSLIALSNTRPTNIFVCSKEEVVKTKGIDLSKLLDSNSQRTIKVKKYNGRWYLTENPF